MSKPGPSRPGGSGDRPTDLATEAADVIEAVVTGVLGLAGWILRHPVVLGLTAGAGAWWWLWGWPSLAVAAGGLAVAAGCWRWLAPVSFDRLVWRHVRSGLLRLAVYGPRWPRWARACHLVLLPEGGGEALVPRIRSVTSGRSWDEVRVRMLAGQTARDYEWAAESLAQSRKVARCAVREVAPGVVSLGFLRRDPLREPTPLPEIPQQDSGTLDLSSALLGVDEYGQPWRVPLLGSHLLGAGMSGSGKGSLMWGSLRMVAPAIASGRVRLSMIDPKGGMEAEIGRELYTRYARDDPDEILQTLQAAVEGMTERKAQLRGQVRKVEPSTEHPLELLAVDELAAVTKYLADRKKQTEAERLLGLLLTQGRALGYVVHAYVQEPTKDVVPFRSLFPYRVALRLDTPSQTDMVLGDGAWQRGAWADRIAVTTPGVGYVIEEGVREPRRVRAAFTSDDEIRHIAAIYDPWA